MHDKPFNLYHYNTIQKRDIHKTATTRRVTLVSVY